MSLQILGILDRGKANVERVEFRVVAPVNLSAYLVFNTTFNPNNTIMAAAQLAFWFPATAVAPGQKVVLYTRGPGPGDTPTAFQHTFYWNLKQTLWNRPEDTAVLINVSGWQTVAGAAAPLGSLYGNLGNLGNLGSQF